MRIDKLAGALGARVTNFNVADAIGADDLFAALHAALLEHQVLVLRDQHITPLEQRALALRFGPIEGHPAYEVVAGSGDVQILESTPEKPSKIELWHSDMTFRSVPPMLTMLHGKVIPPYGGDTLFASQTAAYDALSADMRRFLDGLTARHDFAHGFKESLAEPGGYDRLKGALEANPPVDHPVVRTHPVTGRKALYVNVLFTVRINELTAAESRAVLELLFRHCVCDEFTARIGWQPDTLVMWDNRSTQHKPVNDFFPQHRRMHRITVAGDRPC
jgi:taurine dioxygenase